MIADKIAEEVKALRFTTDKKGKKMPIKKICRKTKLSVREVKYILYEKDNIRVIEIKKSYYQNTYGRLQRAGQLSPLIN